jgi:methionine-rich copper-binding protein CopC
MSRKRQMMRALPRIGAVFLALMALSTTAAHAIDIAATSPTAGAILTVTPNAVSVTTSGPLIDQGNSLVVTDPNGVEMSDGSLVVSNTTAVAGMKQLTLSGTYTVTYTLISDTDGPLTGSYDFTFKAPGAVSSAKPIPSSSTTPMPLNGGGTSGIVFVVLFLAVAVAAFLIWYARQTFGRPKKRSRRK